MKGRRIGSSAPDALPSWSAERREIEALQSSSPKEVLSGTSSAPEFGLSLLEGPNNGVWRFGPKKTFAKRVSAYQA